MSCTEIYVRSYPGSWTDARLAPIDAIDITNSDTNPNLLTGIVPWVRSFHGVHAYLRLAYPVEVTAFTTLPIVRIFGATVEASTLEQFQTDFSNSDATAVEFEKLYDSAGNHSITLQATPSTDVRNLTQKFGEASNKIDMLGHNVILCRIDTAVAVSTVSSGTLADLQDLIKIQGKRI